MIAAGCAHTQPLRILTMPNPYFLVFELIVAGQFLICVRHAWRRGPGALWALVAGAAFGVLLELATIRQLNAYRYGTFTVMVLDVPLAIGVAWGAIIYSARLTSDASGLPGWARPILDGLLALNIDLAMDAVAIRLGMWDWGMGLESQYFGVPWANFWAWFWVVGSFSAGLRLASAWRRRAAPVLAPLAAVVIGLAGVLGTNALITFWVPRPLYEPTVAVTLAAALGVVAWQRPRFGPLPADPPAFWVPFVSHLYFLAAGLTAGILQAVPFLLLVSLVMFGLALRLHTPAWRPRLARQA
jgi:hypothetical protein